MIDKVHEHAGQRRVPGGPQPLPYNKPSRIKKYGDSAEIVQDVAEADGKKRKERIDQEEIDHKVNGRPAHHCQEFLFFRFFSLSIVIDVPVLRTGIMIPGCARVSSGLYLWKRRGCTLARYLRVLQRLLVICVQPQFLGDGCGCLTKRMGVDLGLLLSRRPLLPCLSVEEVEPEREPDQTFHAFQRDLDIIDRTQVQ